MTALASVTLAFSMFFCLWYQSNLASLMPIFFGHDEARVTLLLGLTGIGVGFFLSPALPGLKLNGRSFLILWACLLVVSISSLSMFLYEIPLSWLYLTQLLVFGQIGLLLSICLSALGNTQFFCADYAGGIAGTLISFLVTAYFGIERSLAGLFFVALCGAIIFLLVRRTWLPAAAAAALGSLLLLLIPFIDFDIAQNGRRIQPSWIGSTLVDMQKMMREGTVSLVHSHWSAYGLTEVFRVDESFAKFQRRDLLFRFNGALWGRISEKTVYHPPEVERFSNAVVLGPGGGTELRELAQGFYKKIKAVDLNNSVTEIINSNYRHAFSGGSSGVELLNQEGRAFLHSLAQPTDLILIPQLGRLSGSGLTADLIGGNLFTAEALRLYLDKLSSRGVLVVFMRYSSDLVPGNRFVRLVESASHVLSSLGRRPSAEIALMVVPSEVPTRQAGVLLVGADRKSLRVVADRLQRNHPGAQEFYFPGGRPLPLPRHDVQAELALRALSTSVSAEVRDRFHSDVSVTTDDRPIFFVSSPESFLRVLRSAWAVVGTALGAALLLLLISRTLSSTENKFYPFSFRAIHLDALAAFSGLLFGLLSSRLLDLAYHWNLTPAWGHMIFSLWMLSSGLAAGLVGSVGINLKRIGFLPLMTFLGILIVESNRDSARELFGAWGVWACLGALSFLTTFCLSSLFLRLMERKRALDPGRLPVFMGVNFLLSGLGVGIGPLLVFYSGHLNVWLICLSLFILLLTWMHLSEPKAKIRRTV
jgi:spermidine synthase